MHLEGEERRINEVKKRAIQLTLDLYYDSLQIWYIREYLQWRHEVDKWNNSQEKWMLVVKKIQEEVWEEERICKIERRRRYRENRRRRRNVQHYEWRANNLVRTITYVSRGFFSLPVGHYLGAA